MPTPTNIEEFVDLVQKSAIVEERRLANYLDRLRAASALPAAPNQLAALMVRDGLLTFFQAEQLLQGKWKRFTIGRYKVLEKLGTGGMGSVFLCEHKMMRRRVAVKVLPTTKADDPAALDRFYREAKVIAALDHPNIVRAYDIDQDEKLHFLVMEYVDGSSFQEIIKKAGPMEVLRACNYIRQAALGLQHAHEKAGIVHRDIKPGNILVDRSGIVKILDMGLARFFHDEEDLLTKKYDENVLGTADYLAPEQALDSHGVDIRADIYSLGATFYFLLTGKTPFVEGTVAQKLIWHQTRQPKPIRSLRPEVRDEIVAIIERMMAKDPGQRYSSPQEVVDVLAVWTQVPIPPPPASEMPQLSPAALGVPPADPAPAGPPAAELPNRRGWQVNSSSPASNSGRQAPTLPATASSSAATPLATPALPDSPSHTRPLAAPVAKVLSTLPPATAGPLRQGTAPQAGPGSRTSKPTSKVTPPASRITPAARTPSDEEEPNWGAITPDTDDPKGTNNTAPLSRSRPDRQRSSTRKASPGKTVVLSRNTLMWIIVGISSFLLLALIGIGVLLSFIFSKPGTNAEKDPRNPQPRKTLEVSADGQGGAFKTLQAAINNAGPHERILVKSHVFESVTLTDKHDLVIEAELERQWLPPPAPPKQPRTIASLLTISNCTDVTIRGFIMDAGTQEVDECINVWGKCPGVLITKMQMKNFKKCGILINNCEGTSAKPLQISGIKFDPKAGQPSAVGVLFDFGQATTTCKANRWVTIEDLDFPKSTGMIVRKKGTPFEDIQTGTIKVEER